MHDPCSGKAQPVASFKWHTGPITSVEWHPTEESVIAVSGADHQTTLWDLAVEEDQEGARDASQPDVPPQLLFIHQVRQPAQTAWAGRPCRTCRFDGLFVKRVAPWFNWNCA
jgi:hypothetical protein